MYYQIKNTGVPQFSAFRVTRANFTGEAFDNAPFEGDTGHNWLEIAMRDGVVSLVPSGETTYAVWGVRTPDGEIMLASPGDYIIQTMDTYAIHVCPGPLWELLAELVPEREAEPLPTPEEVEQAVIDAQGRVERAYEVLEDARRKVLYGNNVNWGELVEQFKRDVEAVLGEHVPEDFEDLKANLKMCSDGQAGVHPMDPSKINMRHLAMGTHRLAYNWIDGAGAAVMQQQLAFAKHVFGEQKPDGWENTEKHIDECAEREDFVAGVPRQDLQKTKIARKAQGTRDYCVAMYHNGGDLSPAQWEKVRWSMAWAKMILGDPVSGSDDPIYDELAKRAQYGEHRPQEAAAENFFPTITAEPAQEVPPGAGFAALKGAVDQREADDDLAFQMNEYCDQAHRMFERLKVGEQFDWKGFHAVGLEIADPEKLDQSLVFCKVVFIAEVLSHQQNVTHTDYLVAETQAGIVRRQREDKYKALEYVNTARMWIFETASTEERDWWDMEKKLIWAKVILAIHEETPEDFDRIVKAVSHMIGSHPLGE